VRGLSGAVVIDNGDGTVTKSGGIPERTREQGEWLIQHGSHVFPNVVSLLDDGYIMEKLDYIDYWDIDNSFVHVALLRHVWSQPAVVPPTTNTHRLLKEKMQATIDHHLSGLISSATAAAIIANATAAAVGAYRLKHSLTHGDPTAENVMSREGYGNVLIDPIRATEVVPDSPAVDIGKMLQSAYGWEHAKYNNGMLAYSHNDIADVVNDEELFEVGEAWAVIHVMRAIPYVKRNMPESMPRVIEVLHKAIERA
jgi:hypothetical protein